MTDAQQPAAGPGAAEVDTSPAGAALPTETENASASVPSADRPRPAPSPTSRARRAAAAGVASAAAPVRRPSPVPADGGGAANPSTTAEPTNPKESETKPADGKVSVTKRSGTEPIDASDALQADQARQPHRVRTRSPRWLAMLLAVLALLLAGTSAWLVIAAPGRAGSVSQRDQALSAAKSSVALILSYDYRNFDAGMAKAQAQLTGRANSDYLQAMTKTIKPAAIKSKVIVQAQVDPNSAGVETVSADGKQVTVLVFGQQNVTNTALSAPRIDPFRVRATLDLVAGHWLVSKFDPL